MKLLYSLALIGVSAVLSQGHQVESDTLLEDVELYDTLMEFPVENHALRGRNLDEDDTPDLFNFYYFGSVPQIAKDALANVSKELNSLVMSRPHLKLKRELIIKDVCKIPVSEDVTIKPGILQSIPVFVGPSSRDVDPDLPVETFVCQHYYDDFHTRTLLGVMHFEPAVINDMTINVQYVHDLFLHQAIHMLGFGRYWEKNIIYDDSNYPRYLGHASIDYLYQIPEGDYRKGYGMIPLEDVGGSRRPEAHWMSSIFPTEIMSGVLKEGEKQILSEMTAAAIHDLGYRVNYDSPLIQPYELPNFEDDKPFGNKKPQTFWQNLRHLFP